MPLLLIRTATCLAALGLASFAQPQEPAGAIASSRGRSSAELAVRKVAAPAGDSAPSEAKPVEMGALSKSAELLDAVPADAGDSRESDFQFDLDAIGAWPRGTLLAEFRESDAGSPGAATSSSTSARATSTDLLAHPAEKFWLELGLLDGARRSSLANVGEGWDASFECPCPSLSSAESERRSGRGEPMCERIAVGGWRHGGAYAYFASNGEPEREGFFVAVAPSQVGARSSRWNDIQDLATSAFASATASSASEFPRHFGCGFAWAGPVRGREADVLGLGATWAQFNDAEAAGWSEDAEKVIESFYSIRLTSWLRLQPDLQYVLDPAGDASATDALVAVVRIEITL